MAFGEETALLPCLAAREEHELEQMAGTRLAFTDHPEPEGMNPDNTYFRSHLWDVATGTELAVFPSPEGFYDKPPSLSFH